MCLSWFKRKEKAEKKRSTGNVRRQPVIDERPVFGHSWKYESASCQQAQLRPHRNVKFSIDIEDDEADTGTVREEQPVHEQSWGSAGDSCSPVSESGSCGCDCGE